MFNYKIVREDGYHVSFMELDQEAVTFFGLKTSKSKKYLQNYAKAKGSDDCWKGILDEAIESLVVGGNDLTFTNIINSDFTNRTKVVIARQEEGYTDKTETEFTDTINLSISTHLMTVYEAYKNLNTTYKLFCDWHAKGYRIVEHKGFGTSLD